MASPGAPGASDLYFALRRLGTSGTVLHVGAHPDDEDVGMIAYLSRGLHLRTVYWSATRGEGGQNRHGPERGEALGIVRTWESLDAREVDGGEVLYGPFFDFGFSKSGEAALAAWGRDDVVREIVRAIRMTQPQVVISRWRGDREDGHGQHQAIGMVVDEAFDAAADPRRFSELLDHGLAPWQAAKLYVSVAPDWQPGEDGAFRSTRATPGDGIVVVSTGALDPVSGMTFQELGCLAFNRHQTQGMSFLPEAGDFFYSYRRIRSLVDTADPEDGVFDGLDPSLAALADRPGGAPGLRSLLAEVQAQADVSLDAFRPDDPSAAGRHALEGATALRRVIDALDREVPNDHVRAAIRIALERKLEAFQDAAARCLGLRLECLVSPARVAPGGEVMVTARLWNKGSQRLEREPIELNVPNEWGAMRRNRVDRSDEAAEEFEISVPADAPLSSPYWLREPRGPYRYTWPDRGPLGLPFDPPLVTAACRMVVDGHELDVRAAAVHREVFVGGYRELPPAVLPAMALEPRASIHLLPARAEGQSLELQVAARSVHEGGAKGTLGLRAPAGWGIDPGSQDLVLAGHGETQSVRTKVAVPAGAPAGVYELAYEVTAGERRPGVVVRPVRRGGRGIPRPADESNFVAEAFLISPAEVAVHVLDVAFVSTLRYGYITGAEERIVASLSSFGLDMTVLDEDEVRYADLSRFDAIVVGPHAYLLREDLRTNAGRLLEYVEAGGTLIVQFQGYGYQAAGLAPYPIAYRQPHDRVTSPVARVDVLHPEHSIFHLPNELSAADFDRWVLDRGMYFVGEWDSAYTPMLASNDPGEEPKPGGLLVAPYGRGTYVYAAYSFFRQIPAGVPGATRLFANILAIPEAKILERMKLARGLELLAFMSDARLHEVVRLMSERRFEAGTYLARQGEPGEELFLVLEGEVEILKEGDRGSKTFVARHGEAVGELAALAEVPRSASLRARGEVRALSMRGRHFRALLREHPDLAEEMIKLLATRLATTEQVQPPSGSG